MIAYTKSGILRHYTSDGRRTACGLLVVELETLALPVNCSDCLAVNGERTIVRVL